MSEFIIQAKSIYKSYISQKDIKIDVLKDVSIDIPRSKISVIIGASGAGKSTLLHILSGLDKADSGHIQFDNKEISRLSNRQLAKFRNLNLGFVFQFHHLLPEFSALENCMIPLLIRGKSQSSSKKDAIKFLELVGIQERLDHKPAELSGGEQQRVAVARALVTEPPIIFADEPSGNLDSTNSESLHNLFISLRDSFNKSFVIVTHNKDLVKLADKVFELQDGRLISE